MCGIAGFVGLKENSPSNSNVKKCLLALKRRGPDSKGVFTKDYLKKKILFIHTRLSIIDLNKNANQPFVDNEGSLIFNGMIYNYIELKKKLISKGVKFQTKSDTEVLLKILNLYGEEAFKMLDGMWSLAYYNFKKSEIILSRDRFGEKPLYFSNEKKGIYFSNSIKALQELGQLKLKFDKKKIESQIKYSDKTFGLNNNSFFVGINQLSAGQFIKISVKNNKLKTKNYWKLKIKQNKVNFNTASKKLEKLIKNIVKTRVRSNVKNSMLISGGLDSNTIATYAKDYSKIEGYSLVSSNKKYDETELIKKSSKKNNFFNNFINSNNSKSLNILENIISNSYNILPTTSSLGFALLCEKIKKDKNKMILTGVGGDELFCGYYVNFLAHILSYKGKKFKEKFMFWKTKIKKFIRNKNLKDFNSPDLKKNIYKLNFFIEGKDILNYYFKNNSVPNIKILSKDVFYNNMLQHLFLQNVPTQNLANDLVSMHYSLEARAPFLSYKLCEYIYSTKKDFFMFKGEPKSLLRKAMRIKLDKAILNNYEKVGFYSPFSSFFNAKDKKKILKYLKKSKIIYQFLDKKKLQKLINFKAVDISHGESKLLFACLNFAILEKKINLKS